MNRLFLIGGILVLFLVGGLFLSNLNKEKVEYNNKIDTEILFDSSDRSSSSPGFSKEEIAEIEKTFAEGVARDAGKLTQEQQQAELERIEEILDGRRTAYAPLEDTTKEKING